jgi:hypothetical protein
MPSSTETNQDINLKYQMAPSIAAPPTNEFRFARSTTVLAINDEVSRSPRHLPHHRQAQSNALDGHGSGMKRSQTQILDAKLDSDSFDRDAQIRIRELRCTAMGQQLLEQLERLRITEDCDLFTIKISMFDAILQRMEKILSIVDI